MNVSSSKISDLLSCSMIFYLKHVMMLPDKTHWKTLVGSALHNVVEYALKPKRRKMLDAILENGFSFAAHPNIERYAKMWRDHYKLDLWDHQNVEDMLKLTFTTLKPYLLDGQFRSEQRFEMKLGTAVGSGYIDILTLGDDGRILDMKTKGKKFTQEELEWNMQAMMYQWYYFATYGKLVPVHFIMTRFPPTKKDPGKHIQTVMPPTEVQINGFKLYVQHLHRVMNGFSVKESQSNWHKDEGFCLRVCQLRNRFDYISIKKKATKALVGNHLLDSVPALKDDEYQERLTHKGCPRFNR